jgi:ABC-type Co2+ transport system permease subunit
MEFFGPLCFGLVIGWITYRTLRRQADKVAIGDIAAVIGAVGGATVVGLFRAAAFDSYCIGLAVGFFAYFVVGSLLDKSTNGNGWMGN